METSYMSWISEAVICEQRLQAAAQAELSRKMDEIRDNRERGKREENTKRLHALIHFGGGRIVEHPRGLLNI
jgi:hypothetical protein